MRVLSKKNGSLFPLLFQNISMYKQKRLRRPKWTVSVYARNIRIMYNVKLILSYILKKTPSPLSDGVHPQI